MCGNIANPQTFYDVIISGADYVRCGIGGGSGCITSSNSAVHFPMASLIEEIRKVKVRAAKDYNVPIDSLPKIIADGGIRNYSDVNKALALGADYVMIGGLFSSFLESASPILHDSVNSGWCDLMEGHESEITIHDGFAEFRGQRYLPLKKKFYGMASKDGQISINGKVEKTAEGISKIINVRYNIGGWVENMIHYLRSCMSYCNCTNLNEFIGKVDLVIVSNNTYNSVNK